MARGEGQWVVRTGVVTPLLLGLLSGCGSGRGWDESPSTAEATAQVSSALGSAVGGTTCDTANGGGGWVNTFMPQADGAFSVFFENYPGAPGMPPQLDAVIGLSNGPASAFTDLGPIIRFTPNGLIQARNGDDYGGGFPYTTGVGPFAIRMDVNVATQHYDIWVKHDDSPAKEFEVLGSNFAFRTEQSGVTRLDNIGRFVDSPQGSIETCRFTFTSASACWPSQAGSWLSQAFPAQSGTIRLEMDASVNSGSIDASIGASQGAPTAFSDLGPILRFNPNGTFDARNGANYAADATLQYAPGVTYHVVFDIDVPSATYSVTINASGQQPVALAQNYAFRAEQAHVTSLDHLAQFVDATAGTLNVCSLTVEY